MDKFKAEELEKQFTKNIQQSWNSNIPIYITDEIHERIMAQIEEEFILNRLK